MKATSNLSKPEICAVSVLLWGLVSFVPMIFISNNCNAQSFSEVVQKALVTSPSLQAERHRVDAISEQSIQANNLRRPSIQFESSYGISHSSQDLKPYGQSGTQLRDFYPASVTISASQPLFLGGRVQAALREGDLRYAQGIARVRALELVTARNAIEAYANVLRDYAIFNVRTEGVANLQEQLNGVEIMRSGGMVGLTEVSQVQTRLAGAQGQLASARARLAGSWASLVRIVGEHPEGLTENSLPIILPSTLAEAIELGIKNSHDIKISRFNEDIARANARVIETEYTPRLTLNASSSEFLDNNIRGARNSDTQISARLVIPLWNGGQNQSRVRAAISEANASRLDSLDLEQQLTERITIAWENIIAARENVTTAQAQVTAAEVARNGAQLEQRIGSRTTLDVLNQEQEVLDAKVNLATTNHDLLVSTASLMLMLGFDPTNTITDNTQFYPMNEIQNPFRARYGVPTKWEQPLIGLHEVLVPYDSALRYQTRTLQRALGTEQ